MHGATSPHGTRGGQGEAKGPLRGWVKLAPAATAKTEVEECLHSINIINSFAGVSNIYTYVQSPIPSLLPGMQCRVGWLGCPGLASLFISCSGNGLKQVLPNLSWSLAVTLPWLFAVQVLEQAEIHQDVRMAREGRGVLGLETSKCRFRSSNGKIV